MPYSIHVYYLTDYCVAQSPGGNAEWPPHPARLFMALVAGVYETGADPEQLAALEWLEKQSPPTIYASDGDERSRPDVFVPPNDAETQKNVDKIEGDAVFKKMLVLPQYRTNRQARTFARIRPHVPEVAFAWDVDPGEHVDGLAEACSSVARLGHSASLVQCWLETSPVEAGDRTVRVPDDLGNEQLRVTNKGSLADLDERFNERAIEAFFDRPPRKLKRGETPDPVPPRLRPAMRTSAGYREAGESQLPGTLFDPRPYVLTLSPRKDETTYRFLSAAKGPEVCQQMRAALLSKAGDDAPPMLSGHDANTRPLQGPHVAVLPLADVGFRHSRGHLLGLAVASPRDIGRSDRVAVVQALRQVDHLKLGPLGVWDVRVADAAEDRRGLQIETWTTPKKGSVCWATVTPISLDRHGKSKDPAGQQDEIAGIIRRGCREVGLPEPLRVVPFPVSPFNGAPNGYDYPRQLRKDGSKRRQTHAMLWFNEPVVGPVLLGAGRYRGWGVCRPFKEGGR
jgi:CRISPR-associated protein Csb2